MLLFEIYKMMNDAEKYEGYLIAVYLFDTTALKLALEEVDNQSLVVGLIYIDKCNIIIILNNIFYITATVEYSNDQYRHRLIIC